MIFTLWQAETVHPKNGYPTDCSQATVFTEHGPGTNLKENFYPGLWPNLSMHPNHLLPFR